MWGFLIGLYIYPHLQEWQQRRSNKAALKEDARTSCDGPSMGCGQRPMDRNEVTERLPLWGRRKRAVPGNSAARRCGPLGNRGLLNCDLKTAFGHDR
jgi:hypothetical protein